MKDKKPKYYKENSEMAKARARKRYYAKREEILEKNKKYREKNKDKWKDYHAKYRGKEEHKVKINLRARHRQGGFRDEMIEKTGKCELCGSSENLELHHEDYVKNPKEVKVLCPDCHKKVHRKIFGVDEDGI